MGGMWYVLILSSVRHTEFVRQAYLGIISQVEVISVTLTLLPSSEVNPIFDWARGITLKIQIA